MANLKARSAPTLLLGIKNGEIISTFFIAFSIIRRLYRQVRCFLLSSSCYQRNTRTILTTIWFCTTATLHQPLPVPIGLPEEPALRSEEHTSELQSRGHLVCR